jgi:hypothetical protein
VEKEVAPYCATSKRNVNSGRRLKPYKWKLLEAAPPEDELEELAWLVNLLAAWQLGWRASVIYVTVTCFEEINVFSTGGALPRVSSALSMGSWNITFKQVSILGHGSCRLHTKTVGSNPARNALDDCPHLAVLCCLRQAGHPCKRCRHVYHGS